MLKKLIDFLEEDLSISSKSIVLALRYKSESLTSLPMVLWQYGLITLKELDLIFDWMEDCDLGDFYLQ